MQKNLLVGYVQFFNSPPSSAWSSASLRQARSNMARSYVLFEMSRKIFAEAVMMVPKLRLDALRGKI